MTVFTAYQPVNLKPSVIGAYFSFLASNPIIQVENSTEFKATDGTITIDIRGSGFAYFSHIPFTGTISSLQVNYLGPIYYKFAGMSVPVSTLVSDVNSHNYSAALGLFLPGHDTINGSNSTVLGDYLIDHNGHDRITGGAGNDTMSGGFGNDTFVFRAGFGNDLINKFVANGANHDTIDLHGVPGIAHMNQLPSHESIVGGNLVIKDAAGDSITFTNLHSTAALPHADVIFV
jgi:hypothetical protein